LFSEKQKSIAGSQQYSSLILTLLFGELYVFESLGAHAQFRLSMRSLRVEERIVRLFADRDRQLIDARAIFVFVVEGGGGRDVQGHIGGSESDGGAVFSLRFLELTHLPVGRGLYLMNRRRGSQYFLCLDCLVPRRPGTMQFKIGKCCAQTSAAIVGL